MATFRVQRVNLEEEKLFSKRGKARKDKRVAYNLAQQRKANQQKTTQQSTVKQPVVSTSPVQQQGQSNSTPPAGSTLQLNPSDFQQSNPVNNNSTSQSGNKQTVVQSKTNTSSQSGSTNNQNTTNAGNNNVTAKPLPDIKPENVVIGQQPTGQQGTTGNVDWGQLGSNALSYGKKKLKPLAIGAGVLAGATLAGTALLANKAGKAVAQGADAVGDRLEENRRWRREERMAKRLIKAGYNPYQEGQRIGGYAFTNQGGYYR